MHYFKYFYLVLFLLFASCDNVDYTGIISGLSGTYKSIVFIVPSPNDAGIDIQAAGGYLKLTLKAFSGFSAEIFVPDSINTGHYASGHTFYRGYYTLKDSIIEIENRDFFLKELKWNKLTGQLEYPDIPLRGGTKVILQKIKSSI